MYIENKYLNSLYKASPLFLKYGIAAGYSFLVAQKKYGTTFLYWTKKLKESQYYNQAQLQEFQLELLNEFLVSATANSDFYSRFLLRCNVNPNLFDLKELQNFPIINKMLVKENHSAILNKSSKTYKFSSSGTTGTALHIYLDKDAYQREYAYRWHFFGMAGANRKDRFAYFVGNKLHPSDRGKPPFHLIDIYENSIYFSLFHMSDPNLDYYLKAFNNYGPSFIKGYPSGLFVFAKFIKEKGYKVHKPKAIFSSSETLHDFQRALIEDAFQCPVYQWYGQVETTVNIQECEHRRLHVKEEYGLLELINENGTVAEPGEVASAIGTGWGNKAFPLIRYNTGDNMILSVEKNCSCGRTGRIIEKIIGRDEDYIVSPEGVKIGRLDFIFKPIDTVAESQIVQESLDEITVKVVPLDNFSVKDEKLIIEMVKEYVGNTIQVNILIVSSIERSANGKIRYVISKVKQP